MFTQTHIQSEPRILRRCDVLSRTGLSNSQLYELIGQRSFPAPFKLQSGGRASGWLLAEVNAWIEARAATRAHGAAA